jgi:excisionase family DNA binding protein
MDTSIHGSAKVFYTVAEVAVQFGISTKSVYRLLERGLLKSSSALRRKMIPRASVETFIAASLQGGAR